MTLSIANIPERWDMLMFSFGCIFVLFDPNNKLMTWFGFSLIITGICIAIHNRWSASVKSGFYSSEEDIWFGAYFMIILYVIIMVIYNVLFYFLSQ